MLSINVQIIGFWMKVFFKCLKYLMKQICGKHLVLFNHPCFSGLLVCLKDENTDTAFIFTAEIFFYIFLFLPFSLPLCFFLNSFICSSGWLPTLDPAAPASECWDCKLSVQQPFGAQVSFSGVSLTHRGLRLILTLQPCLWEASLIT